MHLIGRLINHRLLHRPLMAAGSVALLALAITLLISLVKPVPAVAQEEIPFGLSLLKEAPAGAQQVIVGVYPISVYNIDFSGNTYFVEAYVWFRWKGEIDPTATMEFINIVDLWSLISNPIYEEPKELPDGSRYQGLRISGRFSQAFLLDRYPMDQQKLSILLEDTTYSAEELVYIPDTKDSNYADTLRLPGWRIGNWNVESLLHRYNTEFGELGESARNSNFSVLRYELAITRPINFFIWKLLLPLIIVLAMGLCALVIHPSQIDVRIGMPTTALLTTVFLQQSYTDALPDSGNLVLLDKIYVLAYFVIIATVIEVMWSSERYSQDETSHVRVRRIDRILLTTLMAVMVVGTLGLILLG